MLPSCWMLGWPKRTACRFRIYGCYVIGRLWFFVTLDATDSRYTISRAFDATTADILTIFAILAKLKEWVIARVAETVQDGR